MARNIFLFTERTVKNYTVGQAVTHAKAVLAAKGLHQVCVNCIGRHVSYDTKITLEKMSELVEEMVGDTFYYDGWKLQPKD